jgi:hypothetical protein
MVNVKNSNLTEGEGGWNWKSGHRFKTLANLDCVVDGFQQERICQFEYLFNDICASEFAITRPVYILILQFFDVYES